MNDLPEPVAPITEFDLITIFGWYIFYYLLSLIATGIWGKLQARFASSGGFSLREVLLAGPMEEMGFRGLGVAIMTLIGLSHTSDPVIWFVVLMIINGIWAGVHGRGWEVFFFTFFLGIYFSRFWMEGFQGLWWVAVLMHSFHNAFVTFIGNETEKEIDPRRRPRPE